MTKRLALITGQGLLVDEVRRLADVRYGAENCREYCIAPIRPQIYANSPIPLYPFRFGEITARLKDDGFDRVFLVGGFAQGRDWRLAWAILAPLFSKFTLEIDADCWRYYFSTPSRYEPQIRYLLALEAVLRDNGITSVHAKDAFPELNLPSGDMGAVPTPPEVLELAADRLPNVTFRAQSLPSRTAVIDENGMQDVIGKFGGTDAMIKKYGRRSVKGANPFVLKMPSNVLQSALYEPTFGPETINQCNKNGIKGLVVCAPRVRVIDRATTIDLAKHYGLFLYGRPEEGSGG